MSLERKQLDPILENSIKNYWAESLSYKDKVKLIYPQFTDTGFCFGQSHMVMQALLSNDLRTFINRLQCIYYGVPSSTEPDKRITSDDLKRLIDEFNLHDLIPDITKENKNTSNATEIVDQLSHLRSEVETQLENFKESILKENNHDAKPVRKIQPLKNTLLGELLHPHNEISPQELENQIRLAKLIRSAYIKKIHQELSGDSKEEIRKSFLKHLDVFDKKYPFILQLIEIDIYFSNLISYQGSHFFPDFFTEHTRSQQQAVKSIMPILAPVKLDIQDQSASILELDKFTNMYSIKDLVIYFDTLGKSIKSFMKDNQVEYDELPFSLNLTNDYHAISIGYNPKNNKWILTDTRIPYPKEVDPDQIAEEVFCALTSNISFHGKSSTVDLTYSPAKKEFYFKNAIQQSSELEDDKLVLNLLNSSQLKDMADLKLNLNTTIYTAHKTQHFMKPIMESWINNSEFKTINEIRPEQASLVDDFNVGLFEFAVKCNDINKVKAFINQGANLNILTGFSSPIIKAVICNNAEIVTLLMNARADCSNEKILLHVWREGSRDGSMPSFKNDETLLKDAKTNGALLILLAASFNKTNLIDTLINNKADINQALYLAIQLKNRHVINLLLENRHINPNYCKSDNENSLLHLAIKYRQPEIAKKLLALGAKIDSPFSSDLIFNAMFNKETLKLILGSGMIKDINIWRNGQTLLMYAIENGVDLDMINLLLEAKADPNAKQPILTLDDPGWTVLHFADSNEVIQVLLKTRADPNIRNKDGKTPLDEKVEKTYFYADIERKKTCDSVKLLLESNAASDLIKYENIQDSSLYQKCKDDEIKKVLEKFHDGKLDLIRMENLLSRFSEWTVADRKELLQYVSTNLEYREHAIEKNKPIFDKLIKESSHPDRLEFISSLDLTSLTAEQQKMLFFTTITVPDVASVKQLIAMNSAFTVEAKKAFSIATDFEVKRFLLSMDLATMLNVSTEAKSDQRLFSPKSTDKAVMALKEALEQKLSSLELNELAKAHPMLKVPPLEDYFYKVKSFTLTGVFLGHIVRGEKEAAEAMLNAAENNPDLLKALLCDSAQVTDYSGRIIEGTALQLAWGADDVSRKAFPNEGMADMLMVHLRKQLGKDADIEITKQYDTQFPADDEKEEIARNERDLAALNKVFAAVKEAKVQVINDYQTIPDEKSQKALNDFREYLAPKGVIKTGKHFNVNLLVQAFKLYDEKFNDLGGSWEDPRTMLFLQQVIGSIQCLLPACYAQAFCQSLYDVVAGEGKMLKRSLEFRFGLGRYFPLNSDPSFRLGIEYAALSMSRRACTWELSDDTGELFKTYIEQKQQHFASLRRNGSEPLRKDRGLT